MDIIVDLLLELLDKVLHNSKSARTQIVVDILVIAVILLLVGCAVWAYAGSK